MATKKKLPPSKRSGADRSYAIPGLDMGEISKLTLMDGLSDNDDSDDGDLDAELEAIMSGKSSGGRKPRKPNEPVNMNTLQSMVDDCMRSDESDGDENLSGDEDLLAELNKVIEDSPRPPKTSRPEPPVPPHAIRSHRSDSTDDSGPTEGTTLDTLQNRLGNYKQAENSAKAIGDTSKARRYGRGVKSLETLIRECSAGRQINPEDIPPPVAIQSERPAAQQAAIEPRKPSVSDSPSKPLPEAPITPPKEQQEPPVPNRRISMKEIKAENTHTMLTTRRDQYKTAALNAKKNGDTSTAIKYVKIAKQFDIVIEALANGQPIDLSKMPPPLPRSLLTRQVSETSKPSQTAPVIQPQPSEHTPPAQNSSEQIINVENFQGNEEEAQKFFNAPAAPATILEALQQRLEKYQSTQKAAVVEGNTSKAKRLGRIIKQYEDAIKSYKAGRPVDFDSLPAPPGFGEIPGVSAATVAPPPPVPQHKPAPVQQNASPARPAPKTPGEQHPKALAPQPSTKSGRSPSSLLEKQTNFLTERHRLFREAALEAKKNGDLEQAKQYLRMAKGIEPMIEATKSGLPIDATTIPTPPQLKEDFVILEKSECLEDDWIGDKQEMFRTLERDLMKQMDICVKNRDHFLKLGDVSSAEKFENLCKHTKQDLTVVQSMWKKGEALPKFHYENRVFTMVQCHSELGDNEVEVSVVRGINLPGKPKELDSYVKIEFPFPTENPQHAKTPTIKDTNVPEFNASFKFEINRKSRSLARVFKRHNLKLDVWSKGGFLRSDTLLGTASVKLCDFDTKCTIHDSFDLMNGRKACGGKLEVKCCIRDPLLAKQVEEVRERWLIIGS